MTQRNPQWWVQQRLPLVSRPPPETYVVVRDPETGRHHVTLSGSRTYSLVDCPSEGAAFEAAAQMNASARACRSALADDLKQRGIRRWL